MKTLLLALAALAAVPAAADTTHTVVPKDNLWNLAKHYYRNPFRWRVIHAANTNIVKDPHWIYPKQVLVIPDVPNAEVGELPARPVEAQPAALPMAGEPAPAPEPEVIAEPKAPTPPVAGTPERPPKESLSKDLPEGLAAGYPSMRRVKIDPRWKEDGTIIEFEGREIMAAQGDFVQGKLAAAQPGEQFEVYRRVAALEDEDPKGAYVQSVGLVRVEESVGKKAYRLMILKSGDSVQVGDLLKRVGG